MSTNEPKEKRFFWLDEWDGKAKGGYFIRNKLFQIAYLKDKLQSWPDEMCLTSGDIADLITILNEKAGQLCQDVDEILDEILSDLDAQKKRVERLILAQSPPQAEEAK